MGERAKVILNEYSAKNLLMRDTLDLDKFYTADLKLFVEVARKEIERLNNIINELEKYLRNEEAEYDRLYEEQDEQEYLDKYFATRNVLNKLQELKGSDSNVKD